MAPPQIQVNAAQYIIADRSTGELRTVTTAERDELMATGEWFPVCSEPEELTTYTRPRRLHRSPKVAAYVRNRRHAEYLDSLGHDGEAWVRENLLSQERRLREQPSLKQERRRDTSGDADQDDDPAGATQPDLDDRTARRLWEKALELQRRWPRSLLVLHMIADHYLQRIKDGQE